MITPKFADLKLTAERKAFSTKTVPVTSALHNGVGMSNKEKLSPIDNDTTFRNVLNVFFKNYCATHPFKPSVKTAAMIADPATRQIGLQAEKMEYQIWQKKCLSDIHKQVSADPRWMPFIGMYGFQSPSKPKDNAGVSSSWIRDIKIKPGNRISLNGYDYRYNNVAGLKRLLTCDSIGRTVARLKNQGPGATLNGITKLAR